jgi:ATP-dependent DNA helicase RecQ
MFNAAEFTAVCLASPSALGHPRQQARFLCGLSSPALTRNKLSRHPLYGVLEGYRFLEVMRWCEARQSAIE